jgi:hypothetical protein
LLSGSSHPKTQTKTDVCAWCNHKLGSRRYKLRGDPATNYGMCAICLEKHLVVQLPQLPLRPQRHLRSASRHRSLDVHSE